MENNSKEIKMYLIMQLILVILVIVVAAYVVVLIRDTNAKNISNVEENVQIAQEKNNTKNNNTKDEQANIPVVSDNKQSANKASVTKYYYLQLNDNAKIIYDSIEKNEVNMRSGQYEIDLPSEASSVLKETGGDEKLNVNFQSAWDAIGLDRPDLFFIDVSKVNMIITKSSIAMITKYKLAMKPKDSSGYLINETFNGNSVNSMISEIEAQKDEIVDSLSGTDYEKVRKVHNWIVDNIEYDGTVEKSNIYNLYGALVSKTAVCEGYAETFKYLMDCIGIPCVSVVGTATNSNGDTENHEWNYVKIDDEWYAVDCTWDDPIVTGGGKTSDLVKYKYFLRGSDFMNINHYPSGKITSQGMEFVCPTLSKTDYKK